jgi:hypothetical protein
MRITTCPNCQMRVVPKPDGTCPSCYALIPQEGAAPVPKQSVSTSKKETKAAGRKKSAPKESRPVLPGAPGKLSPEQIYGDYSKTARDVWNGSLRAGLPYLLGGVVLAIGCFVASRLTWEWVYLEKQVQRPSTESWVFFWLGIAFILGSLVLGAIKGDQWGKIQIREIVRTRTGFPEFYKAYQKRSWPKIGMPSGPAYDTFLTMIGKK